MNNILKPRHSRPIAFCIVLLTASSAVLSSAAQLSTLSKADKQHLMHDNFKVINKVASIPKPVLGQLLGKSGVDAMANPGQPFQDTDVVVGKPLPFRRLIFGAQSKGYCLVYYERGGIAYYTEVALYRLSPSKAVLTWDAHMREQQPRKDLNSLQSLISKGSYW